MKINAIYPAFDGEVNRFGIGAPTIFVRTQGCHLRCYLKSMGILCDTPEALERPKDQTPISDIISDIENIRATTGINKISLSGGDPLYNDSSRLFHFFNALLEAGFQCTVETSGTLDITPYRGYPNVSWVLDYKLKSCGISPIQVMRTEQNFALLDQHDFLKFVVFDEADYAEMLQVINKIMGFQRRFKMAVGCFWGTPHFTPLSLFDRLVKDGIAGSVVMNFQTHKLVLNPDYKIEIPALI